MGPVGWGTKKIFFVQKHFLWVQDPKKSVFGKKIFQKISGNFVNFSKSEPQPAPLGWGGGRKIFFDQKHFFGVQDRKKNGFGRKKFFRKFTEIFVPKKIFPTADKGHPTLPNFRPAKNFRKNFFVELEPGSFTVEFVVKNGAF